jgi:hypothetical protein
LTAKGGQRFGEPAGELREGGIELVTVLGVNDTEDGFGLSQIEAASQKGAKRELAGAGKASAGFANRFQRGIEQRR